MTYVVIGPVRGLESTHTWTVLEYAEDGTLRGGDHHWLEERFANDARDAYVAGYAKHGDTASKVIAGVLDLKSMAVVCP